MVRCVAWSRRVKVEICGVGVEERRDEGEESDVYTFHTVREYVHTYSVHTYARTQSPPLCIINHSPSAGPTHLLWITPLRLRVDCHQWT